MNTSLETMRQLMEKMKAEFSAVANSDLSNNRLRFDETALKVTLPDDVSVESIQIAPHLSADWLIPAKDSNQNQLLFFHGGGFSVGSSLSHRPLCARIAHHSACKVLCINYRLAPEHKYPAALEDALIAYQWMREKYPDKNIFLVGDSAGGGLVMSTLLSLKQKGLPFPSGAIALSAWLDLECSSASYEKNKNVDLMATAEGLRFVGRGYAHKKIAKDILVSPFYAKDLSGLPPLLIQVGSVETLLDENTSLAEQAKQDGVQVELQIWPNMVHVWHSLYGVIPEAEQAIVAISQWIRNIR